MIVSGRDGGTLFVIAPSQVSAKPNTTFSSDVQCLRDVPVLSARHAMFHCGIDYTDREAMSLLACTEGTPTLMDPFSSRETCSDPSPMLMLIHRP